MTPCLKCLIYGLKSGHPVTSGCRLAVQARTWFLIQ